MQIAILIDAENVLPSFAETIFEQAGAMGDIAKKEIYGSAAALNTWVTPVFRYAIHPNLTIRASKGKNSSDIALVIGAMDILSDNAADTFIIASSDSDFSALSVRLRCAGKHVVGMGVEKSNELWQAACSEFIVMHQNKPAKAQPQPEPAPRNDKPQNNRTSRAKQQPQQQPAKQQTAKQPQQPAEPAKSAHEERLEVIRRFITKRLNDNRGRLQTSTLFPTLNRMKEYREDRQEVGMKPLNYLMHVFKDEFNFVDTPDGNSWISLPGVPAAPETAPAPVTEAPTAVEAAPAAEPVEEIVVEAVEEVIEAVEAVAEDVAEEVVEEAAEAAEPENDVRASMVEAGIPEDAVDRVITIFSESDNPRRAYNALRTQFGNNDGRAYYHIVKKVAEQA